MSDPTSTRLISTTDAMVWAEEFCKTFAGRLVITEAKPYGIGAGVDEGTMVAWFSNAIETGRAHPDHNTLWRVLVGDRVGLYMNSATFHHAVNLIKNMIPVWIDALAADCERQAADDAIAVRAMELPPQPEGFQHG